MVSGWNGYGVFVSGIVTVCPTMVVASEYEAGMDLFWTTGFQATVRQVLVPMMKTMQLQLPATGSNGTAKAESFYTGEVITI